MLALNITAYPVDEFVERYGYGGREIELNSKQWVAFKSRLKGVCEKKEKEKTNGYVLMGDFRWVWRAQTDGLVYIGLDVGLLICGKELVLFSEQQANKTHMSLGLFQNVSAEFVRGKETLLSQYFEGRLFRTSLIEMEYDIFSNEKTPRNWTECCKFEDLMLLRMQSAGIDIHPVDGFGSLDAQVHAIQEEMLSRCGMVRDMASTPYVTSMFPMKAARPAHVSFIGKDMMLYKMK